MANRFSMYALAILFTVTPPLVAQNGPVNSGPWSGVIINSTCTAEEAFAESVKCTTANVAGAQPVFYDDTIRKIYSLDPAATASLGDAVIVRGTLDGNTIRGASITAHPTYGLDVGQKAPGFSARDQFGHEQTLESLKGAKGTVLLFYRSADWCPFCKVSSFNYNPPRVDSKNKGLSWRPSVTTAWIS